MVGDAAYVGVQASVRWARVGFDRVAGQLADLHAVLADRGGPRRGLWVPKLNRSSDPQSHGGAMGPTRRSILAGQWTVTSDTPVGNGDAGETEFVATL